MCCTKFGKASMTTFTFSHFFEIINFDFSSFTSFTTSLFLMRDFLLASCVHAVVYFLTHILNITKIIFFSLLCWILFTKHFHLSLEAPNVKAVLTREALKPNWTWETLNRSETVWIEKKMSWLWEQERNLVGAHWGGIWKSWSSFNFGECFKRSFDEVFLKPFSVVGLIVKLIIFSQNRRQILQYFW